MEYHPRDVPDPAWLGAPIDARSLFAPEHAALMATLRGLTPSDWGREAVPGWTVRDLAAHVLGDCYGRLARDRDHHGGGPVPRRARPSKRSSTASTGSGWPPSPGSAPPRSPRPWT
ncbi:maleylpyruvate isomerase N-terminal domain-containing protein [Streptomyces mobaraensis]|uniref:maleylpyruvate isomerase N-terminal domain-containing protein n=1 Tax=Streptomyces mobaraensis TaxID=35621 RepID=UPI003F4CB9E1